MSNVIRVIDRAKTYRVCSFCNKTAEFVLHCDAKSFGISAQVVSNSADTLPIAAPLTSAREGIPALAGDSSTCAAQMTGRRAGSHNHRISSCTSDSRSKPFDAKVATSDHHRDRSVSHRAQREDRQPGERGLRLDLEHDAELWRIAVSRSKASRSFRVLYERHRHHICVLRDEGEVLDVLEHQSSQREFRPQVDALLGLEFRRAFGDPSDLIRSRSSATPRIAPLILPSSKRIDSPRRTPRNTSASASFESIVEGHGDQERLPFALNEAIAETLFSRLQP